MQHLMRQTFFFASLTMFVAGISANAPMARAEQREQIQICHIPPGNPDKARTIVVDVDALPAHLAHGDYFGGCDVAY
jgi:hypothetical protein